MPNDKPVVTSSGFMIRGAKKPKEIKIATVTPNMSGYSQGHKVVPAPEPGKAIIIGSRGRGHKRDIPSPESTKAMRDEARSLDEKFRKRYKVKMDE